MLSAETRRKRNEAVKGFMKLLKSTDYHFPNKGNLKKELEHLTKDPKFIDLLQDLEKSVTNRNIIQSDELVEYEKFGASSISDEQLHTFVIDAETENQNLSRKIKTTDERITKAKLAIRKLQSQIKYLNNQLIEDQQSQHNLQCILLNQKDEMERIKANLYCSIDDYVGTLKHIEQLYTAEADNAMDSGRDATSISSTSFDKILTMEKKNLLRHTANAKKDFAEISDLMRMGEDEVTPMSFYENSVNHDDTSVELDEEKRQLLKNVTISILGYSPRKKKLVETRAKKAETSATVKKLEEFVFSPDSLRSIEGEKSFVEELETEIKQKRQLVDLKYVELKEVLVKGRKMEREELLGGEYRQLLAKRRLYNRKQSQVKEFLMEQFSCLYLTWMLLKYEICHLHKRNDVVTSLSNLLSSEKAQVKERCERMEKLDDLHLSDHVMSDLIRVDDSVMMDIHEDFVSGADESGNFGLVKYSSVQETAEQIKANNRSVTTRLFQYNPQHPNFVSIKKLLDELCPISSDGKSFEIELSQKDIAKNFSSISKKFDKVKGEFTSIFQTIEQHQNYLQYNSELVEEKYNWVKTALATFNNDQPS